MTSVSEADRPTAPPSLLGRLWRWPLVPLSAYLALGWWGWRLLEQLPALMISVLAAYLIAHPDLPGRLGDVLGTLFSPRGAIVSGVLGALDWTARLFVTLVISVYMMAVHPQIGSFLLRLLPLRFQPLARDVSRHVRRAVGGYFRGQVTVAVIMGLIVGLGLSALRVSSALAIGFLAALINVVPYLGVILSLIPALLLALPLGWIKVLLVAVVAGLFLGANQLEDYVIAPKVMSENTHLSSLTVLLAVLCGVQLFGLLR